MVKEEIKIRRAIPADADLLAALSEVTFREGFSHTCPENDMDHFIQKCFSSDEILKELNDDNDFYFIAYYNGVAAGYTRLKEDYSDYPAMKKYFALELKRIYVLQKYQGKKIGAALMAHALELAGKKNFDAIWLGVWEFNEKAILFYKKWGFSDTGFSHTFHIGNTAQTDYWFIMLIKK